MLEKHLVSMKKKEVIEEKEIIDNYSNMGYKIYTAFEKNSFPSDHKKCVCADCAKCKMCINSNINKIACEIH